MKKRIIIDLDDVITTADGWLYVINTFLGTNYKEEDSKSYYSKLDIVEIPCDINIWFEDGKIIKITLKGYKEFYEIDATYSFSFE